MRAKSRVIGALFFLLVVFFQPVAPVEFKMGKVIAYPNPFSPETDKLTVKPENSSAFSGSVEYKIYDFNQKEVYSGQTSNSAIYWSGHFANGSRIMPGLYFIKIVQTTSDYSTGVSIIKIIVK
ncbi:MAG: T9SS type A sorting domain-containing protein [Spirochaetia bacterium]|nr:T9SS type A sorting domain-containing protein [Spirochaetia bacterium]